MWWDDRPAIEPSSSEVRTVTYLTDEECMEYCVADVRNGVACSLTLMWRMQPQQGKGGKAGKADKKAERVRVYEACDDDTVNGIKLPC